MALGSRKPNFLGILDTCYWERLCYYMLIANLLVVGIHVIALSGRAYDLNPALQVYLYGMIALDLAWNFRKFVSIRQVSPVGAAFVILVTTMCLHGILVGLFLDNKLWELINDTIPLLILGVNVAMMSSAQEQSRPFHVDRFGSRVCVLACMLLSLVLIAKVLGKDINVNFGIALAPEVVQATTLAVVFNFIRVTTLQKALLIIACLVTASDLNRTAMLVIFTIVTIEMSYIFVRRPINALAAVFVAVLVLGGAFSLIPAESRLMVRIESTINFDPNERVGSIGERQAEADAVDFTIRARGGWTRLYGLGHGALYSVQKTHKFVDENGHAHYGWALFQLRYGVVGYIYLSVFGVILAYVFLQSIFIARRSAYAGSILTLFGLAYIFTWFSFNFFIQGLQVALPGRSVGERRLSSHVLKAA
jgi:hypothetical protein